MSKPMVRIHNIETDEVIDREMNAAEFKEYEADQKAESSRQIKAEAKTQAKAELLERLGITADEAKLLLA